MLLRVLSIFEFQVGQSNQNTILTTAFNSSLIKNELTDLPIHIINRVDKHWAQFQKNNVQFKNLKRTSLYDSFRMGYKKVIMHF